MVYSARGLDSSLNEARIFNDTVLPKQPLAAASLSAPGISGKSATWGENDILTTQPPSARNLIETDLSGMNQLGLYPQEVLEVWPAEGRYLVESRNTFCEEDCFKESPGNFKDLNNPLEIPEGVKPYLEASPMVESNSPLIVGLVHTICKSGDSLFTNITKLLAHIGNELKYDQQLASLIGEGQLGYTAVRALQKQKGTCGEYTHCLLAGLRALGVPGRFVVGMLADVNQFHAWAEVYLPQPIVESAKWLPVDPRLNSHPSGNECLSADRINLGVSANHIKMFAGVDYADKVIPRINNWKNTSLIRGL